ncbi:MAG TPA: hypothetical protein VMX97_08795, partial [Hyphomicrobiaceae bacterium]|nr:hypothetical protein [Hyphomicrobiaceae bacterium]
MRMALRTYGHGCNLFSAKALFAKVDTKATRAANINLRKSASGHERAFAAAENKVRIVPVGSTDRRNTYLLERMWSDCHEEEVSSSWIFSSPERGALGSLA